MHEVTRRTHSMCARFCVWSLTTVVGLGVVVGTDQALLQTAAARTGPVKHVKAAKKHQKKKHHKHHAATAGRPHTTATGAACGAVAEEATVVPAPLAPVGPGLASTPVAGSPVPTAPSAGAPTTPAPATPVAATTPPATTPLTTSDDGDDAVIATSTAAVSGDRSVRRAITCTPAPTTATRSPTSGTTTSGTGATPTPGTGTTPTPAPTPAAPAPQSVSIANYAFAPSSITVAKGTTVNWKNNDSDDHTVTSDGAGPLKSPTFNLGGTYSYTFTTAGSFSYHCDVHPSMKGKVIVQ